MPNPSESSLRQAVVAQAVAAFPALQALYAFGSRAGGRPRPDSDLDLALLLPRPIQVDPRALLQLAGDLSALVGHPVDLSILDLNRSVVHCKQVFAGGARWVTIDPHAVTEFERQTLYSYARLSEDRAPVLAAYREPHPASPRGGSTPPGTVAHRQGEVHQSVVEEVT